MLYEERFFTVYYYILSLSHSFLLQTDSLLCFVAAILFVVTVVVAAAADVPVNELEAFEYVTKLLANERHVLILMSIESNICCRKSGKCKKANNFRFTSTEK